jgi:hypothetical protein
VSSSMALGIMVQDMFHSSSLLVNWSRVALSREVVTIKQLIRELNSLKLDLAEVRVFCDNRRWMEVAHGHV